MTQHTIAKIQKAEAAAEAAGMMGEWVDASWIFDAIDQVYGGEPEKRPIRVRSIDGVVRVAEACYSS